VQQLHVAAVAAAEAATEETGKCQTGERARRSIADSVLQPLSIHHGAVGDHLTCSTSARSGDTTSCQALEASTKAS
jgi:hypothetical protein